MNIHHFLRVPGQKHFVQRRGRSLILGIALSLGSGAIALAAIVPNVAPDVANTRHNLSASNSVSPAVGSSFGATVQATSETQICVFCHTPHSAKTGIVAPLWNRSLSASEGSYTFYNSTSLDTLDLPGPVAGDGSKLCLSCHDGTLAIGTVGVLNNTKDVSIDMVAGSTGASGVMPDGAFPNSGFTRKIGIDLSNDHPISFTYNAAGAAADGELYTPSASTLIAVGSRAAARAAGWPTPQFPLVGPTGDQMECITCHDPHLKSDATDPITGELINNKFLRGNRFQLVSPLPTLGVTSPYDPAKDIICLACHNKPTWATSTHANEMATREVYKDDAADLRDFPRNITTWQASCANCHDMHTVPGSRRLLREGTDDPTIPVKVGGGTPAIEQVCYQCHSPGGAGGPRILNQDTPDQVPDIKSDFEKTYRMPIATAEQGNVPFGGGPTAPSTIEVHDIGKKALGPPDTSAIDNPDPTHRGKDFVETRTLMGYDLANRHAECTDCHQPHRVTRTQLFNDDPMTAASSGTHRHAGSGDPGGVPHNNLASGSQRGHFGVEPVYSSNSFYAEPSSFVEKRGAADTGASTDVNSAWLTREYQVCAKCHSNYGFGTNRPNLGRFNGATPVGTPYKTNGMETYTNIFREIQAPIAHQGNSTPGDSGAHKGMTPYSNPANNYFVDFQTNNRRSWHPVMRPTGRTPALRGNAAATNWLWPWTNDVGNLTMYCTDCHGSSTPAGQSNQPVDGSPEGPHGSQNIFLLKGWWDQCTGNNPSAAVLTQCLTVNAAAGIRDGARTVSPSYPQNTAIRPAGDPTGANDLCFKCHAFIVYGDGSGAGNSGFGLNSNLHSHHTGRGGDGFRCMWCHIAVPHGWKNKAFLVNLNDVGPEAICRQEDWEDVPAGYRCNETVGEGNPVLPGSQLGRNEGLPTPSLPPNQNHPANNPTGTWDGIGYTNPPYYRNALLKINNFAASGDWTQSNCTSVGPPGIGVGSGCGLWMTSTEGCAGTAP